MRARQFMAPEGVAFVTPDEVAYGMLRMYMAMAEDFDPDFELSRSRRSEEWLGALGEQEQT